MKHFNVKSFVPTVEAAAYASGDVMGGKNTVTVATQGAGGQGILRSIALKFKDVANAQNVDVLIFRDDPSATTFAENGAVAIAAADVTKLIAVVQCATHFAISATASISFKECRVPLSGLTNQTLYVVLVPRGAITPASTSGVLVELAIEE